jgi:non-ribosomal peptide synthetase component E (peptide arylation enzyme)
VSFHFIQFIAVAGNAHLSCPGSLGTLFQFGNLLSDYIDFFARMSFLLSEFIQ